MSKPDEFTDNFKSNVICIFSSVRAKLKKTLCPRTLCILNLTRKWYKHQTKIGTLYISMCKLKKLTAHWFSRFFFFIIYWFFYPIRTDCQIQSVNSLNNMKIWEIFCEKRFCIKKSLRNYVNSLLPCFPFGKSL